MNQPLLPVLFRAPSGRFVPASQMLAAYKKLRTVKPTTQCPGWSHFPEDAATILREIRRAIHERINARGNCIPPPDDIEMMRFANRVNHPRLVLEPWERRICPPQLLAQPHIASRFRDSDSF